MPGSTRRGFAETRLVLGVSEIFDPEIRGKPGPTADAFVLAVVEPVLLGPVVRDGVAGGIGIGEDAVERIQRRAVVRYLGAAGRVHSEAVIVLRQEVVIDRRALVFLVEQDGFARDRLGGILVEGYAVVVHVRDRVAAHLNAVLRDDRCRPDADDVVEGHFGVRTSRHDGTVV